MKPAAPKGTTARIRVVVVDDHPVVREGLVAILSRQPDLEVVGEGSDGAEAVALAAKLRPDVTLIDLRMPGMGGVEAIETVRRCDASARFVVLTTFDGDEDVFRALRAGALAYLLKDAPKDALLSAIRAAAAGKRSIPPAIAEKLAGRLPASELSARELEVLRKVVAGRTNREIAAELSIGEATVKTHVVNVFGKLGVSDRTEAATAAIRRGIVHLDD